MGKASRDKGYRGENNLRKILQKNNIKCHRVPLSGAAEGSKGDIIIQGDRSEVKLRKNGFKTIYEWLNDNKYLFIKADRKEYLCVMRIIDFIELLKNKLK